ncbi:hypothetical protein VULLAG_LOCUS10258 [Vulpes lagopus]
MNASGILAFTIVISPHPQIPVSTEQRVGWLAVLQIPPLPNYFKLFSLVSELLMRSQTASRGERWPIQELKSLNSSWKGSGFEHTKRRQPTQGLDCTWAPDNWCPRWMTAGEDTALPLRLAAVCLEDFQKPRPA